MSANKKKLWLFEYLTCFTTGFAVLALELVAFRILAPFFGMSIYVTGIIINAILFALAIGYALGGYAADRTHSWKLPYVAILISAIYLTIVYILNTPLLEFLSNASVIPGTTTAVVVLFFIPMVLIAFLPPYLIKLISTHEEVGTTAGRIYAVSTLGSILGGITTTFAFIPILGSLSTFFITVVLLFLVAISGLVRSTALKITYPLLLIPLLGVTNLKECDCIYSGESEYNYITITENKGQRLLKLNDGAGFHSHSINPNTMLTNEYYDHFLLPLILSNINNILILGNGAGTSMTQIAKLFDTNIDGVEIDPKLTILGETYFGLNLSSKLRVFNEDARTFINKNKRKYDLILVDIYAGGPFVPFHVTTVQFFRKIRQSLSENGVVAINIPAFSLDQELGEYYLNTIANVFPERTYLSGCIVYSFLSEINIDKMRTSIRSKQLPNTLIELAEKTINHMQLLEHTGSNKILSDDYAPVGYLTQTALKEHPDFVCKEQASRFP
jgi:spermidine synthase